jgi:hypothetical protein
MTEHRFQTPGALTLRIDVPAGGVEIRTVDGEESTVVLEGDERLLEQIEVDLHGDTLIVSHRSNRILGISVFGGWFGKGEGRLRVRASVPHGVEPRLTVASADVRIVGRCRALDVTSASGDLTVVGDVAGDATVKTVSGTVRNDRVGGTFTCQTVSGDVEAGWIGGSAVARSVAGDLRLGSLREGQARFTSVSGDVEIGIAAGSFLDVDAGSVSGDLSSEVPLANVPGEPGDGPTVVLRGRTVSGDLKVFRAS